MTKLTVLDKVLVDFTQENNYELVFNRSGMPVELVNFEERRINWSNNGLKLSIIIQPTFTSSGVDSSEWNFVAVAWKDLDGKRYKLIKSFIKTKDLSLIENHFEELLIEASRFLNNLKFQDLELM